MLSQEQKLKKLTDILTMMDQNLSKEDFLKSFENIINYVKAFEARIQKEHDAMMAEHRTAIANIHQGVDGKDGAVGPQGVSGKDGLDGKDGKNGKDGARGPAGRDGKDGLTPDITPHIKKLEDWKTSMEQRVKDIPSKPVTTIFGPGKTKVRLADISDKLDGVTKSFTLPTNFGIVGVYSSSAPFTFRPTIDFKEVGRTIVFEASIDAPSMLAQGQTIIVQYIR